MTRRRRIFSAILASACALVAIALVVLWWRSRTNMDILAWTTQRLDPVTAAAELPPGWNNGPLFSGAIRTFSIHSEDGVIRFSNDVYFQHTPSSIGLFGSTDPVHDPTPLKVSPPYPFPAEPSLWCR